MLKKLSMLGLLFLTGAGAESKIPTQAARFSLVRVTPSGEVKLGPREPVANSPCRLYVQALKKDCVVVVTGFRGQGDGDAGYFKPYVFPLKKDQVVSQDILFKPGAPNGQIFVTVLEPGDCQAFIDQAKNFEQAAQRKQVFKTNGEWSGLQSQLGHSGPLPAQLGGVVPSSANAGHPNAPIAAEAASIKANSADDQHSRAPVPAAALKPNWTAQADWVTYKPGLPGVYTYRVKMK